MLEFDNVITMHELKEHDNKLGKGNRLVSEDFLYDLSKFISCI